MPEIITRNNRILAEPSLADLLTLFKKQIFLDLNCHAVGTIKSFNSITQTATVSINYKKTFFKKIPSGEQISYLVDYPLLVDAPVIILQGGHVALTFPVTAGDECVVLFNDRDIDNWLMTGQVGPVATQRFHDMSDGMILIGVNSILKKITSYDPVRGGLKYKGGGEVMVGPALVRIANATTTLNTLLSNLITEIQSLVTQTAAITVTGVTTGTGVSGPPANAATIAAINTQLTTTATQLAALLE